MARPATPAPLAAAAASLLQLCASPRKRSAPTIYVAAGDRRARALHALLAALDPELKLALFPEWDVLPYDRLEPSAAIMGARMGVLRWLTDADNPPTLVVTTAAALLRRLPPRDIWPAAHLEFARGETIDPGAARAALEALGYAESDVVSQPGEAAFRGRVIDVFPAAAPMPCRILFDETGVTAIRSYDPLSQASEADSDLLIVDPASELLGEGARETFFDYAETARLIVEDGAEPRIDAAFAQIAEGAAGRRDAKAGERPEEDFLTEDEWRAARERLGRPRWKKPSGEPTPNFAREKDAGRALDAFVADQIEAGRAVLLMGQGEGLAQLARRLRRRAGGEIPRALGWRAASKTPPGKIAALAAPIDRGIVLEDDRLAIVAAADYLGSRAVAASQSAQPAPLLLETDMRIGDVVVHRDHGLALLDGLETIETPGQASRDFLRLVYGDESRQMCPVEDIGLLWRYGADPEAVTLDRLDRDSWAKRKAKVAADIAVTARRLVEMANEREAGEAPVLAPAADRYERFAERFAYVPTPDQAAAIEAALDDLASGKPMDRLVCGDVGYGKTEVALRAAAAAVFSGHQVAMLAPTTLLARQHLRTFQRRFAGLGVEIVELSRLVEAAESRQAKAALASGDAQIAIGTHAVAGKGVSFHKLGLVIIDEEQKFGTQHKAQARALAAGAHVLTLTATPIPRTLQASLVGLQDISVIATPPHLRLPIRTRVAPSSRDLIRDALTREKRRGGQSFFVVPRVSDVDSVAATLAEIVPDLKVLVAHGQMSPTEADDAMLAFADGDADVLLATSIIESGLDVPGANTLFVHEAGRFGMAQLHQLRGRVGRGSRRAYVYLLNDGCETWAGAEKRLHALAALDHLGAGFAIAARDLDLRGAGDLLGDDQAGHVKLIGVGLYQELLAHALALARGEEPDDAPPPEFNLGLPARIPDDYVPDPDLRLALYAQIARIDDEEDAAAAESAIVDRFGPMPGETAALLAYARLRPLCRALRLRRLDAGPAGMAATFAPGRMAAFDCGDRGWKVDGDKVVAREGSDDPAARLALLQDFVGELAACFDESTARTERKTVRARRK